MLGWSNPTNPIFPTETCAPEATRRCVYGQNHGNEYLARQATAVPGGGSLMALYGRQNNAWAKETLIARGAKVSEWRLDFRDHERT